MAVLPVGAYIKLRQHPDFALASKHSTLMTNEELLEIAHDYVGVAKQSCGIGFSRVGMFLKVPVGFAYATSSLTGKSYNGKTSKCGLPCRRDD
jgi:hypothetical protein